MLSPSYIFMFLYLGINVSVLSPKSFVITSLSFPLVSLPKLTTPEDSANIAGSFGFLCFK